MEKGRLLVIYCIRLSKLYFELELLTFQLINILYISITEYKYKLNLKIFECFKALSS